jgi:hypothetical protein
MKEVRQILAAYRKNKNYTIEKAEKELLDLFSVVKRFKATFDNEGTKDIEEYFWAENKDEAFKKVFEKYPKAKFVMI